MVRRYSKKVREEAALICSATSSEHTINGNPTATTWNVGVAMRLSRLALDLAGDAWSAVYQAGVNGIAERYAEAASWLRTGWTP